MSAGIASVASEIFCGSRQLFGLEEFSNACATGMGMRNALFAVAYLGAGIVSLISFRVESRNLVEK